MGEGESIKKWWGFGEAGTMPPLTTMRLGADTDPYSKPGGSQAVSKERTGAACGMLLTDPHRAPFYSL